MWSCSKCNKRFETRIHLISHYGTDCFQKGMDTSPEKPSLHLNITSCLQDETDESMVEDDDDTDADPMYDPETDGIPLKKNNLNKRKNLMHLKYYSDSSSEDSMVSEVYGENTKNHLTNTQSADFEHDMPNKEISSEPHNVSASPSQAHGVLAMLSEPQDVATSLYQSEDVAASLNEPKDVAALLNQLQEATTSLDQLQEATASLDQQQDVAASVNQPQDVAALVNQPQDVTAPLDEPQDSVASQSKGKRKKGVRKREEEMKKKELGLAYTNRKGKPIPAKHFSPINSCCRNLCYLQCSPEKQQDIFCAFISKPKEAKNEILCGRISLFKKTVERKNRGKSEKTRNRQISVKYSLIIGTSKIKVCKIMFSHVHGISRAKVNHLIGKLQKSSTGLVQVDTRGKHTPKNKLMHERERIRLFINGYPRHVSHYSRRESTEKIFLPSHLTITKMYNEYKHQGGKDNKLACYDVFRDVFNSTGFKFKQPYTDTCKKCDEYKMKKRFCTNEEERERLSHLHDEHILEAEQGYANKKLDKGSAKDHPDETVLVFDLQQVLSTPLLSTNVAYYKRLLSTYNLTVRDCKADEYTQCFMWHEAVGGRGSDQIASCIFKKLLMLPDSIKRVTTYSDTCGGQNRNVNMAIMFSYVMLKKPSFEVINQKFLLPGHTRLECDSDHARIEKAKKEISPDMSIMAPRDWYSFVRMVSGKKRKFQVFPMTREDFLAFSKVLVKNVLVKRTTDLNGEKIEWLKIKWLQYRSTFGVINFKYTLDKDAPFRTLDLRRQKRGRPLTLNSIDIPLSYIGRVPINPLKKQDLLSMLPLIDEDCHEFYRELPTVEEAAEFDELEDVDGYDSNDEH